MDVLRVLGCSLFLSAVVALLAACGSGEEITTEQSAAACDQIQELQSYRYKIAIKLNTPAFQPSATGPAPAPNLTAFADTLAALLSDLAIEGAYVAPDRTQAILRFQQNLLEVRAIGEKTWVSDGGRFQERQASGDVALLTPDIVCRDVVQEILQSLEGVDSEPETINGVETERYTLSDDLESLPELLGASSATDLPKDFQVNLWLAHDGRWPVRLDIGALDEDAQGQISGLTLNMEIRDVNDPGIGIDAPPASSAGG